MVTCYCYSNRPFSECCEPFITRTAPPETPVQLMRSRFTACVLADVNYFRDTMKGKALEGFDLDETKASMEHAEWLGLEILSASQPSANDHLATVEFITTVRHCHQIHQSHEISHFKREQDRWYYVNGKNKPYQPRAAKIGRNDPCPCNSGTKYKKCCGK